jgi:CRISPR-associated exonuclease Cas4
VNTIRSISITGDENTSIDTSKYDEPHAVNTFAYCHRRWYYQQVLKFFEHNDHTEIGAHVHDRRHEDGVEKRSEVFIVSHRLKLKGKCDYIMNVLEKKVPVEIKKGKDKFGVPAFNDVMQLVCYVLMIEERYGEPAPTGIIIYAGSRKRYEIAIHGYHKRQLYRLLASMRSMKNLHKIPERTKNKNRCVKCSINARCLSGT